MPEKNNNIIFKTNHHKTISKTKDKYFNGTMVGVAACLVKGMPEVHKEFNGGKDTGAWLRAEIEKAQHDAERELDSLTAHLVSTGLANWTGTAEDRQLIIRGQANLLGDLKAIDDLERVRLLFSDLETKKDVIDLLSRAETGEGVRIYIGSENKLFSLSGSSMIAAPFRDSQQKIVGVLGIIGPTRLNYAKVVPMVDYTAKIISKLIESSRS